MSRLATNGNDGWAGYVSGYVHCTFTTGVFKRNKSQNRGVINFQLTIHRFPEQNKMKKIVKDVSKVKSILASVLYNTWLHDDKPSVGSMVGLLLSCFVSFQQKSISFHQFNN